MKKPIVKILKLTDWLKKKAGVKIFMEKAEKFKVIGDGVNVPIDLKKLEQDYYSFSPELARELEDTMDRVIRLHENSQSFVEWASGNFGIGT